MRHARAPGKGRHGIRGGHPGRCSGGEAGRGEGRRMAAEIEHGFIETNRVRLDVAEAGPADGPLVILLHGFPECWYGWRHQIAPLAAAGLRVVAPDQRGYNLSDKPAGIAAYRLDMLADDVIGIADALGQERFAVAGHDWGGVVAWHL